MTHIGLPPALLLSATVLMAQAPYLGPNELAKESKEIVVGIVLDRNLWVIQPEKVVPPWSEPQPDGTRLLHLQSPSEYVIGQLRLVKLDEIIRGSTKAKAGDVMTVFTPGFASSDVAALAKGKRYALFLSPLQSDDKRFTASVIQNPGDTLAKKKKFDPSTAYSVVGGYFGALRLDTEDVELLDRIRKAAATTR